MQYKNTLRRNLKMNRNSLLGTRKMVSKALSEEVLKAAKEINNAAKTGDGATSISALPKSEARTFLESISSRIIDKSTRFINIKKLEKIMLIEKSFEKELTENPLIKEAQSLAPELRYSYTRLALSTLGRPTVKLVENTLKNLNLEYEVPTASQNIAISKVLASKFGFSKEDIVSVMEKIELDARIGKDRGGKPTMEIKHLAENLNEEAARRGIPLRIFPTPTADIYKSLSLESFYDDKCASDALIYYVDKKGKATAVSMEFFGWKGTDYEKNMVHKAIQRANKGGHLVSAYAPLYGKNSKDLVEKLERIFSENMPSNISSLETRTYAWVLQNDNSCGSTDEDSIYRCFYNILNSIKLTKLMPVSKFEALSRPLEESLKEIEKEDAIYELYTV